MECRKHNHHGNKGVCPCCLRDKLSRLPNTTSYYIIHRSDSSPSSTTTVSSSPSLSPPVKVVVKDNHHHRRGGSMSMSFAVREALTSGSGLKKSRSMAHVPENSKMTTEKLKSTKVKKVGFWSKLLHFKGKGGGGGGGSGVVGGLVTSGQRVC